jgi:pimeloyl-ACP methyl ester carboxylesterase
MSPHRPSSLKAIALRVPVAAALILTLGLSGCGAAESSRGPLARGAPWTPVTIPLETGVALTGESGHVAVPERRDSAASREIDIGFRRFPSTAARPGEPVFMLAGGPGGSYNEQLDEGGQRQRDAARLIDIFRQTGDVVLVDLRGVYLSAPNTLCDGPKRKLRYVSRADQYAELFEDAGSACRQKLLDEGFDLAGYNVLEAAADVLAVADALGYSRVQLYGASFGSHWALALAKEHPDRVSAMVLEGVEGLDHTVDDPEVVHGAVSRIAKAAVAAWGDARGQMILTRRFNCSPNWPCFLQMTPSASRGPRSN